MFAISEIEGGTNHVNVRNFLKLLKMYLFIYLFICHVFVESVIVFVSFMKSRRQGKSHFQDI